MRVCRMRGPWSSGLPNFVFFQKLAVCFCLALYCASHTEPVKDKAAPEWPLPSAVAGPEFERSWVASVPEPFVPCGPSQGCHPEDFPLAKTIGSASSWHVFRSARSCRCWPSPQDAQANREDVRRPGEDLRAWRRLLERGLVRGLPCFAQSRRHSSQGYMWVPDSCPSRGWWALRHEQAENHDPAGADEVPRIC